MVSAIDVADWVALFGVVMVGEVPRTASAGPDVRVFYVPVGDVCILDTWRTTGMRGTGSKTVIVNDVFIPANLAELAPSVSAYRNKSPTSKIMGGHGSESMSPGM